MNLKLRVIACGACEDASKEGYTRIARQSGLSAPDQTGDVGLAWLMRGEKAIEFTVLCKGRLASVAWYDGQGKWRAAWKIRITSSDFFAPTQG
jgi:hypothetical protein